MTKASAGQIELFAPARRLPRGFACAEDVITVAEEDTLVAAVAKLPFKPFEFHGHLGNRRIVSFGWRYDYGGRALRAADPIPGFLLPLRQRAAAFAGIAGETLQHALVTEYAPGAGIGWHRDKREFGDVIAVSLLAPCTLRFRRRDGAGWERISLPVGGRSAYLLRGAARHDWEHSIPLVGRLRYSVTFRTLAEGGSLPATS